MKRRRALYLTAGILGTSLVGSELFLSGCARKQTEDGLISNSDVLLLDEVGETILPETAESPGAKAVQIGRFMKDIVTDCYDEKEQKIFKKGLASLNELTRNKHGKDFMDIDSNEKHDLISELDKQSRNRVNATIPHYFQMMKELTLWGYFTSEPGATMALRYNPIPGKYLGCVPYKIGDKAWAT